MRFRRAAPADVRLSVLQNTADPLSNYPCNVKSAKYYDEGHQHNDKRAGDFALVKYNEEITEEVANEALEVLKIDKYGLDNTDRCLLKLIIEKYNGGPVGIETIAAAIGEDVRTIEDVCEPYLLQAGLLQRTPRGRKVSPEAYRHLGYEVNNFNYQQSLF